MTRVVLFSLGVMSAALCSVPLAAETASSPVTAQTVYGDSVGIAPTGDYYAQVRQARRFIPVRQYTASLATGQCLVQQAGPSVGGMVVSPTSDDGDYNRLASGLRDHSSCVQPGILGASMGLMNGALAETLLRGSNPVLPDHANIKSIQTMTFYLGDRLTMDGVGRCVAAYSSGIAYRVLLTQPGSTEETQALNDLYSETPQCGVALAPQEVDPVTQRAAIASGLYQWLRRG